MPKLKWKTKGNSNPQGKPRVYFCCHQDDFEKYFDSVSEEIMKNQNCAIYYDCEPEGEVTEEWLSYLGEMQLFVIPVTTKFLTKDNKGISTEFPFAEERHIPVLPLMQENGLDDIFSVKMGSLQYLNKYSEDRTGISYEEKLDKYLNSVLVGDELAQKIRDAFDAYIFLSYRKKDRVYAQQLMRLIHENEFCRDIAIWYDEFLTPGENFNDSIEEALKKSKLFALAVTPNLVNEENYVMNVEYPMAKGAGKTILPAEVVKTDRAELEKKYEGIPVCADAHNESELSKALEDALNGIAVRENDGDPKHNFFIGLAYLSGIDVEVNHERALRLITSAAEAGLTEAMEKLVSMYRNGEGVARSYETAIEWQEKLVEVRRAEWKNNPSEYNVCVLCSELWILGDYYTEMHKYAESLRVYREMNSVSAGALEAFKSSKKLRRYLSVSYEKLGNIYEAEGRLAEAKEMYLKDLDLSKEIFEETGTVESGRALSVSYNNLGNIYEAEGRLTEAKEMYLKSLELRIVISEETGTVESGRDLSVSCGKLGDIYVAEGRLTEAMEMYTKSLGLFKVISEETGTVESRRDLSISYNNLGNIYESEGRLTEAKEMYLKGFELRKVISEETGTVESRRDLSISYNNLGNTYNSEGRLTEAKEMYLKSLELSKVISEETGTVESRRDLSVSCEWLGNIYMAEGRLTEAKEMYLKSLELRKAI
ncbi:MAG: tetratricopeptide repeat protein, partial [Clostridia bacterium]|nr:tetratricopeptide repeat protein [Clostridia bacterium]